MEGYYSMSERVKQAFISPVRGLASERVHFTFSLRGYFLPEMSLGCLNQNLQNESRRSRFNRGINRMKQWALLFYAAFAGVGIKERF